MRKRDPAGCGRPANRHPSRGEWPGHNFPITASAEAGLTGPQGPAGSMGRTAGDHSRIHGWGRRMSSWLLPPYANALPWEPDSASERTQLHLSYRRGKISGGAEPSDTRKARTWRRRRSQEDAHGGSPRLAPPPTPLVKNADATVRGTPNLRARVRPSSERQQPPPPALRRRGSPNPAWLGPARG